MFAGHAGDRTPNRKEQRTKNNAWLSSAGVAEYVYIYIYIYIYSMCVCIYISPESDRGSRSGPYSLQQYKAAIGRVRSVT